MGPLGEHGFAKASSTWRAVGAARRSLDGRVRTPLVWGAAAVGPVLLVIGVEAVVKTVDLNVLITG